MAEWIDEQLTEAERRIEEQLVLIEVLQRDRHDTRVATEVLATFLRIPDQMTSMRDAFARQKRLGR